MVNRRSVVVERLNQDSYVLQPGCMQPFFYFIISITIFTWRSRTLQTGVGVSRLVVRVQDLYAIVQDFAREAMGIRLDFDSLSCAPK